MPGIWNVNNVYTNNTKKVSSKMTFESGEKFTGRIVAKGQGKDVTIRLADGWQFIAEIDQDVNLDDLKLVKFQVDDFKDGKLRLKLIKGESTKGEVVDDVFQEVIDKEGLSKEDIKILEKMLKHNITLTRENINKVKGLIQFNENINLNSEEIDTFIQNYLQSKGIDLSSTKGQLIKQSLTEFFNSFKNMSSEEIIVFLENNLEFSSQNIESFNKLFKSDMPIEKLLMQLNAKSEKLDENIDTLQNKEVIYDNVKGNNEQNNNEKVKNNVNSLISKLYDSNDNSKNKVSMLSLLKSIVGDHEELMNSPLNDMINSRSESLTTKEFNRLISLTSKFSDDNIIDMIKTDLSKSGISLDSIKENGLESLGEKGKAILENTLSNALGKEFKLTDKEFKNFNDMIKYKLQSENVEQGTNLKPENPQINKEIQQSQVLKNTLDNIVPKDNIVVSNKDLIKEEMMNKIGEMKEIVKNIMNNIDNKIIGYEKIVEFIKSNINDFKVFNSVSDEYYYLNFPVNINSEDYPCKLIIKDNRKDGKKIDKTNAKMVVSVKTMNLGEVDGYLTLKDNRIDINLKCDDNSANTLDNNKTKLINGLKTLGLIPTVKISLKQENVNLATCSDFFNDLSISSIDIKV